MRWWMTCLGRLVDASLPCSSASTEVWVHWVPVFADVIMITVRWYMRYSGLRQAPGRSHRRMQQCASSSVRGVGRFHPSHNPEADRPRRQNFPRPECATGHSLPMRGLA